MIAMEQLAGVFVELADTLVDEFDVIEFLELVTTHSASMSRSASAGLLLANLHGELQFMAASEESVKLLELFQLQIHEGPCLDCFRSGSAVINTDLARAGDRWPRFAPRAVSAGFASVHAFPLRHRKRMIGALNMFSANTGRLEPSDVCIIQALADIASIGLLQERSVRDLELMSEQLQGALNRRMTIEQAKGALASTHGINVDEAYELMRGYASRTHHLLSEAAQAVVTDPASHPELTGATSGRLASAREDDRLLTPAEVASLFRVDPKTVTRWAKDGKLASIRTLGGHRRYLSSEVTRLLDSQ